MSREDKESSAQFNQGELNFEAAFHHDIAHHPIDTDLIGLCIRKIVDEHRHTLPDLSALWIITHNSHATHEIKSRLLTACIEHGHSAILPPNIGTLDDYLSSLPLSDVTPLSDQALELVLVSALQDFTHLYPGHNPWALSSSLLELFHQLTLWHADISEHTDEFMRLVLNAYGGQTDASPQAMDFETRMVHGLWFALRQQLNTEKLIDRQGARLIRMQFDMRQSTRKEKVYIIGYIPRFPLFKQWQFALQQQRRLIHLQHHSPLLDLLDGNQIHAKNIAALFPAAHAFTGDFPHALHYVYDCGSFNFLDRSRQCATRFPTSPISEKLSIYNAPNTELEARAVDIQVRQWCLQGKRNIAIVTENRKLARRIRALLERANIAIKDGAGWPLSTTRAAGLLERWLECIEQDFHYMPLLDLLKSDFFAQAQQQSDYLHSVYLFEQGIVLEESITNNIQRFIHHIQLRRQRLPAPLGEGFTPITSLLQTIDACAQPVKKFFSTNQFSPADCIAALVDSLKQLNLHEVLIADDAGQRVLEELRIMRLACAHSAIKLNWTEFRGWLGANLEKHNFRLIDTPQHVQLLSLAQTHLLHFDAVIICGAEYGQLPHALSHSPFFNDRVHRELGIPSKYQNQYLDFYYFAQLLINTAQPDNAKDGIVITRRLADSDEEIQACPWVEALQAFHQITYGNTLLNHHLAHAVNSDKAYVHVDNRQLPSAVPVHPRISIPIHLLPKLISANAYQQLIDCPYQFYVSRSLKLQPPDVIRDMLKKSDYGERVHLALHAFHMQVADLPPPFSQLITDTNRQQAIDHLSVVSRAVFQRDIEDNFLHRGWLHQWLELVPKYIDWQIKQQALWRVVYCELNIKNIEIANELSLSGRIDRIDKGENGLCITDYKTGHTAVLQDIENGEAVQLPYYTLLLEHWMTQSDHQQLFFSTANAKTTQAQFLQLSKQRVGSPVTLRDEALSEIAQANKQRLLVVMQQLREQHAAPAWGDETACRYCHAEGICRKSQWI